MEITDEFYDKFIESHSEQINSDQNKGSVALALQQFLKEHIEKILNNFCLHHNDQTGDFIANNHGHHHEFDRDSSKIEIQDIQFAFNNAEIIKKLRERGEKIKNQQFAKVQKMDEDITKFI